MPQSNLCATLLTILPTDTFSLISKFYDMAFMSSFPRYLITTADTGRKLKKKALRKKRHWEEDFPEVFGKFRVYPVYREYNGWWITYQIPFYVKPNTCSESTITTRTLNRGYPASIYLLKVNNRNTRTRCEICSKSTIKTLKRQQ